MATFILIGLIGVVSHHSHGVAQSLVSECIFKTPSVAFWALWLDFVFAVAFSIAMAMRHRRANLDSWSSDDDVAEDANSREAAKRCMGTLCPWCSAGCTPEEHGNLKKAQLHYLTAVAEAKQVRQEERMTAWQEYCLTQIRKASLWSCAAQVDGCNPSREDVDMIDELIRDQYVPERTKWRALGLGSTQMQLALPPPPPPPHASAVAVFSDMDTEEVAAEDAGKKPWYDAPWNKDWRSEPWVRERPGHHRIIEVLISKKQKKWLKLETWLAEKIFEVYDQEKIGATTDEYAVRTDEETLLLTYRCEGGAWLCQRNTLHPGSARTVRVLLVQDALESWRRPWWDDEQW